MAIVGGGIAGLSAALHLETARRQNGEISYVLCERSPRLGGLLRTERVAGCLVEAGADSFLTEKPWALDLCRTLGLEAELIGSNDAQRQTWIAIAGKLLPLPEGMRFIVPTSLDSIMASDLFSAQGRARIAAEREFVFPSRKNTDEDETVAAFIERHFGKEMVERVADPLLTGIYGVAARRLSAQAVLSQFLQMERSHGSLMRALASSPIANPSRPIFTSLKDGMQRFVDAIVSHLDPACIRLNCSVLWANWQNSQWRLRQMKMQEKSHSEEAFDGVILALPAPSAASILSTAFPALAGVLQSIPYTSSLTVALGYEPSAVRRQSPPLPPGFGFLVSQSGSAMKEGGRQATENMLACTFVHQKFAHRAPPGWALLRAFFAGQEGEPAPALSDAEAKAAVRRQLAEMIGWKAEPAFTRVYRWPQAMPVYEVGHLEKLREIERLRKHRPALALIGNAYRGIGIPDCIREGQQAAEEILRPASATSPVQRG